MKSRRCLSVQSHVVSGYVGNKAAMFPLELIGFEVDAIHSVQFGHHTGYGKVSGQILTGAELSEMLESLNRHDISKTYTHILSGYVKYPDCLVTLAEYIKKLKSQQECFYLCDPVLGDNGNFYVDKSVLPIYQEHLLPLADLITPNHFEAGIDDGWKAIQLLQDRYAIPSVVISSIQLPGSNVHYTIGCVENKRFSIESEIIDCAFTGSGDVFSALLLGYYDKFKDLVVACEFTVCTLHSILIRTRQRALEVIADEGIRPESLDFASSRRFYELKIIDSREDIINPKAALKATII